MQCYYRHLGVRMPTRTYVRLPAPGAGDATSRRPKRALSAKRAHAVVRLAPKGWSHVSARGAASDGAMEMGERAAAAVCASFEA